MTESITSSQFLVTGLDCADCALKVEKAVKRIPGVTNATITFPTGRLNVDFAPQQTNIALVINKVKKLGYDAREEEKKTQEVSDVSKTTDFCI
ncbi:MAG TPA: heavy metal translocating P-type ATPase, partial [Methanosarcina sp.]|nr:heavy metal translocating P-type ATPase [Methanosarcina sp.]